MSDNPLTKYFRQPAIHLALPSRGDFYPDGVLSLPETGEVPIYPMTAIDEITYKTPDALFNGSATVDVIKSCVPAFKDPWQILTLDLNPILIAIRIASVGETLELDSTCPKCNETNTYEVDLTELSDQHADISKYNEPKVLGDLSILFKPLTYKDINQSDKIRFEESRLEGLIDREDIDDQEKIRILSESFKTISKYTIESIVKSIRTIATPEAVVSDSEQIGEFLRNCERDTYNAIRDHIFKLREMEDLKPFHIKCADCEHKYDQSYMLDMTTFFDKSS